MNASADIQLRPARVEDLAAVHALNQACRPALGDEVLGFMQHWQQQALYFQVAWAGDSFAGFLLGMLPDDDYGSVNFQWFRRHLDRFFYIDRVAVVPAFQRRGVGRLLYLDVEQWSRQRQLERIACEVNIRPLNQDSLDFHQALGFAVVGEQDTEAGHKRVALMVRELGA